MISEKNLSRVGLALAYSAVFALAGTVSADQTPSTTINLGNLFANLESRLPSGQPNYVTVDLTSVSFRNPYLMFRVRTNWQQVAPTGNSGAWSVDAGVTFYDAAIPSTRVRLSDGVGAYDARTNGSAVTNLSFLGAFDPALSSRASMDMVYTNSTFGEFGTANFNNTRLELFTANDIGTGTYTSGLRAANAPTNVVNVGNISSASFSIVGSDTSGVPFRAVQMALYGANGRLISSAVQQSAPNASMVFGDGDLVIQQNTGEFFLDGGLSVGEYFLGVAEQSVIFGEGFSFSGSTASVHRVSIAGQSLSGANATGGAQFYRFSVVPTPATAVVLVSACPVLLRRRR